MFKDLRCINMILVFEFSIYFIDYIEKVEILCFEGRIGLSY